MVIFSTITITIQLRKAGDSAGGPNITDSVSTEGVWGQFENNLFYTSIYLSYHSNQTCFMR